MDISNNTLSLTTPYISTIPAQSQTATSFTLNVRSITLFNSANILVEFRDASLNLVETKSLDLSGNDYTSWGNND
jgi:hypothetical protein